MGGGKVISKNENPCENDLKEYGSQSVKDSDNGDCDEEVRQVDANENDGGDHLQGHSRSVRQVA